MRMQLKKLTKRHSTRAERRFAELCKKLHIPFRAKVKVMGREVDFIIGAYAIDIDGHRQDVMKNKMLILEGYTPIHFNNWDIPNDGLEEWLKQITSMTPDLLVALQALAQQYNVEIAGTVTPVTPVAGEPFDVKPQ